MRSALTLAAQYLSEARSALGEGDLAAARRNAVAASESAEQAISSLGRPSFKIGSYLPVVREDVGALAALSRASKEAATALTSATSAAARLGITMEGTESSIFSEGRVDLLALEEATPDVLAAGAALGRASELLDATYDVHVPQIGDALEEARRYVGDAQASSETARLVFSVLPPILGADAPRRYLFAFQALGEARATGGLIGLVGVLDTEEGALTLDTVAPVLEVFPDPLPPVDAPAWFEASYQRQQALSQIQQANVSPNVPVAAEVVLQMYEEAQGESLDGVVLMDAVSLQQLLVATGPIQSPLYPTELNGENAADVILRDLYLEFEDEARQNLFLTDVVERFWEQVNDGDLDAAAFAQALGEASREGHLKMYLRDETQADLSLLGLTGGYPIESVNPQLVFHNNYGVNKVDYFLRRSIETEVTLTEEGSAEVEVTAVLRNEAPAGPPSTLIGDGTAVPPGFNRMLLSFMLPASAQQIEMTRADEALEAQMWTEDELPVASSVISIGPGGSETVSLTYQLPGAFDPAIDEPVFELTMLPHTAVKQDSYTLRVNPPSSYSIRAPAGSLHATGYLERKGRLVGAQGFTVLLSKKR